MYILVYHTNGRSIKITISMVVNRLVGMGLKSKARTHTSIFKRSALESALESANSSSKAADSSANPPAGMELSPTLHNHRPTLHNHRPTLHRVGRLSVSNMFKGT